MRTRACRAQQEASTARAMIRLGLRPTARVRWTFASSLWSAWHVPADRRARLGITLSVPGTQFANARLTSESSTARAPLAPRVRRMSQETTLSGATRLRAVAYIELLVVNDKARCDAARSLSEMHATPPGRRVGGDDIRGRDWIPDEDAGRVGRPGGLVRRRPTRRDVFYLRVARRHRSRRVPDAGNRRRRAASAFGIWRHVNLHTSEERRAICSPARPEGKLRRRRVSIQRVFRRLLVLRRDQPEDPSETLRSGDCAFDSKRGASGATVL